MSTLTSPHARDTAAGSGSPLLSVRDLTVRYEPKLQPAATAVDGVSFDLYPGEFVGLIGESGCGKSTLGLALLHLLQRPARVTDGSVAYTATDGTTTDLVGADEESLRSLRWTEIATVFQSSMNSLNPVTRIGATFADVLHAHTDLDRRQIHERSAELLEMVSIEPKFLSSYPHELSGGMKQRVNLALALALRPRFVLLDEPTTGLDVVVQRTILDKVRALQAELGFTVLFVSHDMGTVLESSDRILVMYAGRIVEQGTSAALVRQPLHPYTKALLGSYGDPRAEQVRVTYIPGRPPSLVRRPPGCAFADRCPEVIEACRTIDPPLVTVPAERDGRAGAPAQVACLVAAAQHGRPTREVPASEIPPQVSGFAGPAFVRHADADGADGRRSPDSAPRHRTLIEVEKLTKTFTRRRGLHKQTLVAVDDVSFALAAGRVTALVGQSGSGKSTIAKIITGAERPTDGRVLFHPREGAPIAVDTLRGRDRHAFRRAVQYVFQDPYAALNPTTTIGETVSRPIRNFDPEAGGRSGRTGRVRDRVVELLEQVGLAPGGNYLGRFPYQLSGGQRQRVVIAKALATRPDLLVADEPISSLDVSIRAEILELLQSLVRGDGPGQGGVGILYITHDLLSARMLADDALVLRDGRVVESGPVDRVILHPTDPYTRTLLEAIPDPTRRGVA